MRFPSRKTSSVAARRADTAGRASSNESSSTFADADWGRSGRIVRIRSADGLRLAARIFDTVRSDRLPLLCLPGLSRNSRDFIPLGRYFAEHVSAPRKVVALDYRGRGLSDADPHWWNYKPIVEAQDVLSVAAALGIERAILVGTSRGGIISMLLGAIRPGMIAGAVLNDIGPVLEGRGLARIKTYLSSRRNVADWSEAVALVRSTAEAQFPGLAEDDWRHFARAYFAPAKSGLAPQFDPNLCRTVVDIDVTARIPVLWPQFMSLARVPVLAIRGEHSDLLSPRTLAEMGERHPQLEAITVAGQGHAPLLHDMETLSRIANFAARCNA